jgi:ubiquinone/menaquinone biosynthesis C-methylase UbiE
MADYVLTLSEGELARYRFMAETARAQESDLWTAAGIVPGATVADVGCGPAATAVAMAQVVGPTGRVIGVERDATALGHAAQLIAAAGVSNVDLRPGDATATTLEPGSVDTAVLRHVLAHNGGQEQAIVDHLVTLVRPGGWVYLVDVDISAVRMWPVEPDLADLSDRYAEFHRNRGNDPAVGLRLRSLLETAGLEAVEHRGTFVITQQPPGVRPPPWVAREAMVHAGTITAADADRWTAALDRLDGHPDRPALFIAQFTGLGRRPA